MISAVIPIRKGSQRVKKKNLRKFNKKNLLIYKIEKLKKLKNLDEIIINTDSEEAIEIAKKYGVSFVKRSLYFASSKCTNSEFWSNVAENTNNKFIMFTNCTSPLIKIKTYQDIINNFLKKKKLIKSINIVTPIKDFLYYKNKPVNFNPSKAPNSQNLDKTFKLNFAVNIISKQEMFNKRTLVSTKPFFYHLDELEGFDIDTMLDFKVAEFLHRSKQI